MGKHGSHLGIDKGSAESKKTSNDPDTDKKSGWGSSPAKNPLVVNIPAPTTFPMIRRVASRRLSQRFRFMR